MTIKKVYQAIINVLEANKDKKVSAVLPEILGLAQVKQTRERTSETVILDVVGLVVAIRDSYFKRWCPIVGRKAVEFGAKKGSKTGFSGMSVLGQSKFSAAKNRAVKEEKELLARLANGEVLTAEQIKAEQEAIQKRRETPVAVLNDAGEDVTPGFENIEDCIDYLKACKIKLAEKTVDKQAKAA